MVLQGKNSRKKYCRTTNEQIKAIYKMKLENPNATMREIGDKVGVIPKTAHEILRKLPTVVNKLDRETIIMNYLDEIITNILTITKNNILKYMDTKREFTPRELKDLSVIARDTFERKQILEGKPTSINHYDVNLEGKSLTELEDMRQRLLMR